MFKITKCQARGTDFWGRAPIFKSIFAVPAVTCFLPVFPSPNSQHARVYNETVKFHHKLKLGMQELSLKQTFSFEKMQFLYKATNKEAKLVIIVTVPTPLGLLNIAGTRLSREPVNSGVWAKDYECDVEF